MAGIYSHKPHYQTSLYSLTIIYIVQVSTGHLLAVVSQHYQPVSVLTFTDDGQWLISGGEDGKVIVWSLRQ